MWQHFVEQRTESQPFTCLSVAVDVNPERVRAYADPVEATFPTVVDSAGVLGRVFDFDVVPNGIFVDAEGVIRFIHIGGFDVRRPEIAAQVDALLSTDFGREPAPRLVHQDRPEVELLRNEIAVHSDDASLHFALADALLTEGRPGEAEPLFARAVELNAGDWSAAFGLGTALYQQGHLAGALRWWKVARQLDPDNFTVRKQIWMVEHPERFYPTIDLDWQKKQLRLEGYVRPT